MKAQTKQRILFALIMGVVTTGLISFVLISSNTGFRSSFVKWWLKSWALAYLIVVPVILFVGPRVQALVSRMTKRD